MLTARGEETDRVVGLELGADDYVVKPFSAREVVARIRAVLRRTAPVPRRRPGPVEVGDVRLDLDRRDVTTSGDALDLSSEEFDLLQLLMANSGTVVKRERLIEEVWDTNWFGTTKTLDVHVSGLRKKLGDDSSEPRYLHTARGVGFRFAAPEEAGRASREPPPSSPRRVRLHPLLVLVALEVPLALNLSRRVDAEVKNDAASQAISVPRGASGSIDRPGTCRASPRRPGATRRPRHRRHRPRLLGQIGGDGVAGASYAAAPRSGWRSSGRRAQGERQSESWAPTSSTRRASDHQNQQTVGAVRVTQSVEEIGAGKVWRDILALAVSGLVALLLGLGLAWILAGLSGATPARAGAHGESRVAGGDSSARADVVRLDGSSCEVAAGVQRDDQAWHVLVRGRSETSWPTPPISSGRR